MLKISIICDENSIKERLKSTVEKMGADYRLTGVSQSLTAAVLDTVKNKPDVVIIANKGIEIKPKYFDRYNVIAIKSTTLSEYDGKAEKIYDRDIEVKLERLIKSFEKKVEEEVKIVPEKESYKYERSSGYEKTSSDEERGEREIDHSARRSKKCDLVIIGVSTGGPYALKEVIPHIKPELKVPVIIIQHMPAGFTKDLAKGLNIVAKVEVKEAEEEELKNGVIYVVPGGRNTYIAETGQKLKFKFYNEKYGFYTPSVDYMLETAADLKSVNPLVVIMTGMGNDGFQGIKKMRKNGKGFFLTQSHKSCVVYGMPRVIDEAEYSDISGLELKQIADEINKRVG